MKRTIILLILLISTLFLVACNNQSEEQNEDNAGTLRVVTSIFPQFDFVRQIAGDRVELTMLISPGAESHSFEPTPQDIITLNEADLFIYIGGHAEVWVDSILDSLESETLRSVALIDFVDEILMGEHQHHGHVYDCIDDDCPTDEAHYHEHDYDNNDHHHDHYHEHDYDNDHHHDHYHGHDYDNNDHHHDHYHGYDYDNDHHHDQELHEDDHVWTSPRNAIAIVMALADILAALDPDNAYYFHANAASYIAELEELDRAFAEVAEQGARRIVIFGDRFPFRYLMHAYELSFLSAFPGCSADTHASPATITYLIDMITVLDVPVVFYIEFSNRMVADVLVEATGVRLLEMHSVHNVSHADFEAGVTYLDLMRRNVEHLREALN